MERVRRESVPVPPAFVLLCACPRAGAGMVRWWWHGEVREEGERAGEGEALGKPRGCLSARRVSRGTDRSVDVFPCRCSVWTQKI